LQTQWSGAPTFAALVGRGADGVDAMAQFGNLMMMMMMMMMMSYWWVVKNVAVFEGE
jgi:hypothetical protein